MWSAAGRQLRRGNRCIPAVGNRFASTNGRRAPPGAQPRSRRDYLYRSSGTREPRRSTPFDSAAGRVRRRSFARSGGEVTASNLRRSANERTVAFREPTEWSAAGREIESVRDRSAVRKWAVPRSTGSRAPSTEFSSGCRMASGSAVARGCMGCCRGEYEDSVERTW